MKNYYLFTFCPYTLYDIVDITTFFWINFDRNCNKNNLLQQIGYSNVKLTIFLTKFQYLHHVVLFVSFDLKCLVYICCIYFVVARHLRENKQ